MTARNSIIARMRFVGIALLFVLAAISRPAQAQQPSSTPADFPPVEATAVDEPLAGEAVAAGPSARSAPGLPTDLVGIARALDYWLIPFVLATLIALWFSAERLVVLRRGRVIPKPFVDRFLKHLEDGTISRDEALEVCEENGSPVAQVFAHGVRKWGKPSVEVEQAIIDGGERQVSQLRSHLRVLNGVATITPLLGLLGTVWGMLEAFNDIAIAGSMGNTTVLASGIALALLTTAAGLVIAIPSLIIYMYLSGRVDSLVMDMDELSQNIVHTISAEALSDKRPRTTTPPRKKAAS
jgi:biopolymer transport protein ExbB